MFAQPVVVSPPVTNLARATIGIVGDGQTQILLRFRSKCLIWRIADAATSIINMTKFHGQRTCTLNIREYLPDTYNNMTHTSIATMLAQEEYLAETHTIKIYSWDFFQSVSLIKKYYWNSATQNINYYLLLMSFLNLIIMIKYEYPSNTYQLNCLSRRLKLFYQNMTATGKTYYPGITHNNKHFTTGTRVYQCIKLKNEIPRHLYEFGRYLRICYDSQLKNNLTLPDKNKPPSKEISKLSETYL